LENLNTPAISSNEGDDFSVFGQRLWPREQHSSTAHEFEGPPDAEQGTPCSLGPCGQHAQCWNVNREDYRCTCERSHPEGNPYYGCSECLYDQHCGEGGMCQNKTCIERPPPSTDDDIPEDYVTVIND